MSCPLNTVKPCLAGLSSITWLDDQIRITCVVITYYFIFFFPSLSEAKSVIAELQALCNVFSSIYQLFFHTISPCQYLCVQGLYPFSETYFQDFSRTF